MKSYTDLEQSKKLAKILPIESADMYWKNGVSDKYFQCFTPYVRDGTNIDYDYDVPCWSLSALLSVLPKIHKLKPILDLEENSIQYSGIDLYVVADNPIDACYEMIIKLHERKML